MTKLVPLLIGIAAGFLLAAAGLSDPAVIRKMLLLEEAHVFLLMGAAIATAAIGVRLVKRWRSRALIDGQPIGWKTERPEARHVLGSVLFGAGWSIAGTCPGPAAAMIGQSLGAGLVVGAGIAGGALLKGVLDRWRGRALAREAQVVGL